MKIKYFVIVSILSFVIIATLSIIIFGLSKDLYEGQIRYEGLKYANSYLMNCIGTQLTKENDDTDKIYDCMAQSMKYEAGLLSIEK